MATSTPDPTDGASSSFALALPKHESLDTVAAQAAAIDAMIGLARRAIGVFDFDLSGADWNTEARTSAIAAFLRAHRAGTLRIVVHDTGWIEGSCPRLTRLLKYHADAISICRTGSEARHAMDPLVIVDDQHYLHRFHFGQPRALFAVDDPAGAQPLVTRFDAIWASAEPGISATVLGL